ncbi:MAG: hypothetical protein ACYC6A_16415 [Armatimonadota bacterium]
MQPLGGKPTNYPRRQDAGAIIAGRDTGGATINRKRYLIGWTLSTLGLAALVVLIAVPVLLVSPFYTACQQQAAAYSQPLLPVQFVDRLILSLGQTLYTGIRLYVAIAAALLIAGWLVSGTLSRQGLRLAATVLFVLGLAWLAWTAMHSYAYTEDPARLRAQVLQMEMPNEFYTPGEVAAKIWSFATPIPGKIRAEFQLPVFWLLLVHVLARFAWTLKRRKHSEDAGLPSKQPI